MSALVTAADVAVIGAGSSGLAALRALRMQGIAAECFERGSAVGGLWRYENDNGLSGAYASLRTNVSRPRMQYPSFPMPCSYADFPGHRDMAAYLDAYAEAFGLREFIRFRASVERLEPDPSGGWFLTLDGGSVRRYRSVVVAIGLFWCPKVPDYPGVFSGATIHSHEYRTSEPFEDRRVLVVGAGQSAAEIAVEVSRVASQTFISVHSGTHVLPRWIGGKPYDARDIDPLNRIPWRLMNLIYSRRVAQELEPAPTSWPMGVNRVLEGIPIVSSDLIPAVRRGHVVVKPAIDRLGHDRVYFVDGSEEVLDRIVYCTGYRISLPFMASSLVSASGRDFPLYRRIVPTDLSGLFLAGFVDAPGGLLPVVEAQGEWIAAVLAGRLLLPPRERMRQVMERPERRTRQRFPGETPSSIRCDPHAYQRLLRADLRRGRHFELRASGKSRADVLRRSERRRSSSASDDEVGGLHARLREQLTRTFRAASVGKIARRRAEEERVEAFFLCERRRSRRTPRAIARAAHKKSAYRQPGHRELRRGDEPTSVLTREVCGRPQRRIRDHLRGDAVVSQIRCCGPNFRRVGHKAVNMLFIQSFQLSFSSRCRGGRASGVPGRGRVA